jgi:hypothetical protein
MHIKKLFTAIVLVTISVIGRAQNPPAEAGKPIDVIRFFEGNWTGEGRFANGKKIAADASFKLSLDSCWLLYTHTDLLPGRYKAISMWGTGRTKAGFPAIIFDNSHNSRSFTGLYENDNEIILSRKSEQNAVQYFERFVYTILDSDHFKMAYEISKDGIAWREGDSLTFARK